MALPEINTALACPDFSESQEQMTKKEIRDLVRYAVVLCDKHDIGKDTLKFIAVSAMIHEISESMNTMDTNNKYFDLCFKH